MAAQPAIPYDVLLLICEHLSLAHPPSLREFALVCRSWAAIANTQRYHSISLSTISSRDLAQSIESLRASLRRSNSFKYVRRLAIGEVCLFQDSFDNENHKPASGWRLTPHQNLGEDYYDAGSSDMVIYGDERHATDWPEDAWQPVATVVSQLPALSDVLWNCPQQVPACLLKMLHDKRSFCRLWVNTFWLKSPNGSTISEHEWSLITSPCLHAIRAEYLRVHSEQGMIQATTHLAPNLKKVAVINRYQQPRPGTDKRPLCEGLETRKSSSLFEKGGLTYLSIPDTNDPDLEYWINWTDFAALEHLTISSWPRQRCLSFLACHAFSKLKSLSFKICSRQTKNDRWSDDVRQFLLTIPPLDDLKLQYQIHLLPLDVILGHHGRALQRLWLHQWTEHQERPEEPRDLILDTATLVENLPHACPHLRQLAVPVRRSQGNEREVASYKSLGQLRKLRVLDLTLECSDYSLFWACDNRNNPGNQAEPPTDPHFDEFDQAIFPDAFVGTVARVRNGHIARAMIDAAVDETLARSIFRCISSETLERLSIKPRNTAMFSDFGNRPITLQRVMEEISYDWLVERNVRDDMREELIVKDISGVPDESRNYVGEEFELRGPALQVFRRLWPELHDEERRHWTKQWHSFPLETSSS